MAKMDMKVSELVAKIQSGEIRLPEMQRRYVWRATHVRDLLDSLYRGYPSGGILMWQAKGEVKLQEMAVAQEKSSVNGSLLLLDGQQRLTSLSAVIRGEPVKVRGHKKPLELLFNLNHPDKVETVSEVVEEGEEEDTDDEVDASSSDLEKKFDQMTFIVSVAKLEKHPHWVKVSEVFKSTSDAEFLTAAGVASFTDPNYAKFSGRLGRLRAIKDYAYRVDILEDTLSYEEVTEIFVRVNSRGLKLRSSDLALAQITTRWKGALTAFEAYQSQCEKAGFPLDLGLHLKNLIAFATGQSRFRTVGQLSEGELKAGWKACKAGMDFALNFVKSNAGLTSPVLLSSPFVLVTLGMYGRQLNYHLSAEEAESLKRWVLLANAKARYSRGSSETFLDQDLSTVQSGGGAAGLLERLTAQVGNLSILPGELEGRNQQSALFKTMFLAFRAAGAKDWKSQVAIDFKHQGQQHQLQFHHLFPKAVLKDLGLKRAEIDDLANLAFIGGKTNQQISKTPPIDYLPQVVAKAGATALSAQCVPAQPELWALTSYKDFLKTRRQLICERLNGFLGTTAGESHA